MKTLNMAIITSFRRKDNGHLRIAALFYGVIALIVIAIIPICQVHKRGFLAHCWCDGKYQWRCLPLEGLIEPFQVPVRSLY